MNPSLNGEMECSEYQKAVLHDKNSASSKNTPNLAKVIALLLSFPFSNAAVETFFSQLSLIKSKHRVSLKGETLLALLQSKAHFKDRDQDKVQNMNQQEEMISLQKMMPNNATKNDATKNDVTKNDATKNDA